MFVIIGFYVQSLYELAEKLLEQKDFDIPRSYAKNFLEEMRESLYHKKWDKPLLGFLKEVEYDDCKFLPDQSNEYSKKHMFGIMLKLNDDTIDFSELEDEKWKVYRTIKKLKYDLDDTEIKVKFSTYDMQTEQNNNNSE